jgi:hypothetical protein
MDFVRAHKLLLAVYGSMLLLAGFELSNPEIVIGRPEAPETYLRPDYNIADVSAAMYPDRALSLYYRAHQVALCGQPGAERNEVCREHGPVEAGEVRELLERAIATGNRSLEELLYNYAAVLIQEGAPEAEIEAAVEHWRSTHPGSNRPDPREVFRPLVSSRPRPRS